MYKKRAGRPTRREQIESFNALHRFYADAVGVKPMVQLAVPKLRTRSTTSKRSTIPLERDVLKAVLQALRYDPRVASVERQQSGVFLEGNRHIRVGTPGALDIKGMLKGGRMFEIECKRPGGKPDPRQAARIARIRADGGVAGYCWSVESALALLP